MVAIADIQDKLTRQLVMAESLLRQIRDGKHSLPGTLTQIDRYFAQRAEEWSTRPRPRGERDA